jgi:hypothetical protein
MAMAVICREHRLLFIAVPHTGSTAISDLLIREMGGEWIPPEDFTAPDGTLVRRKHTTLQQLLAGGVISAEERARLFVISAVRNPFDTLVSTYVRNREHNQPLRDKADSFIHKRRRKRDDLDYCLDHTFDEWIDHSFGPRLIDRVTGRGVKVRRKAPFQEGVDFVMRYEHLQEDFDEALRRAGVDRRLVIPTRNVTTERTERDYRTWYSGRSRKLVQKAFAEQLRRFGYAF